MIESAFFFYKIVRNGFFHRRKMKEKKDLRREDCNDATKCNTDVQIFRNLILRIHLWEKGLPFVHNSLS